MIDDDPWQTPKKALVCSATGRHDSSRNAANRGAPQWCASSCNKVASELGLCFNRRTTPAGTLVLSFQPPRGVDAVAEQIRRTGARATPARIRVLQLLRDAPAALTHNEIESALGALAIDRVTLYRVLDWLADTVAILAVLAPLQLARWRKS